MTDPLNRYERDLDRAKAADIFDAASAGRVVTRRQDALKKGFDYTQTTQDVEDYKKAGQTIPQGKQFTSDGGYKSGEDIMGEQLTSTDVTGKYEGMTDEQLEEHRSTLPKDHPYYRASQKG